MHPLYYFLHGITIEINWDEEQVADVVDAILEYFGFKRLLIRDEEPDLRLTFTEVDQLTLPEEAQHIVQHNGVDVWVDNPFVYLQEGASLIQLDPIQKTGIAVLKSPFWIGEGVVRIELVNLVIHSFLLLMREFGFFPLHAAALEQDGQGILLVAESDSGKSTQAMNLVRLGWKYLSDDSILLQKRDQQIMAFSLRRDFGVDQEGVDETDPIRQHWKPFLTDERKRRVDMTHLFPNQGIDHCPPTLLLFPEVTLEPTTELVPLARADALLRVIQQTSLLTLNPQMASAHLDVMGQMIQQAQSYVLRAGLDIKEDPTLLAALLAEIQ